MFVPEEISHDHVSPPAENWRNATTICTCGCSHLPFATSINYTIMLSSRAILRVTRAAAAQKIAAARAASVSQIRSYATPAAPDSKPPIALYGLDGTYASALVSPNQFFVGESLPQGAQLAAQELVSFNIAGD